MKRLLLLAFLLTLWTFPLSSLPSTPVVNEWPLCFSESEFLALEDQVWAETEKTVKEAVNAAVVPYEAAIGALEADLKAMTAQRNAWSVAAFSASAICVLTAVVCIVFKPHALLGN
jgi:hypothetical protein